MLDHPLNFVEYLDGSGRPVSRCRARYIVEVTAVRATAGPPSYRRRLLDGGGDGVLLPVDRNCG